MSTPKDALHEDTPRELEDLSPEERERRAKSSANDVKLLTRYALICSAVGLGIAVLAVRAGVQGAEPFARGLTVGALTTLLNLRLLARGAWSLMAHKDALQGALFMGGSVALLVGVASFLAVRYPDLVLGFGLGLALPAPAGIWFGLKLKSRPD
jgi:hypothetical protein